MYLLYTCRAWLLCGWQEPYPAVSQSGGSMDASPSSTAKQLKSESTEMLGKKSF